ncbi:chromosome segregation protein SMC [Pistricoccus aurantiacus]|uniref:Nuclease SbcCD subunit C n=1 Tax=Pistricoccus aurantiacus TaxID=1883414 RepID=A0A5B8SQD6_9GAMM|nr:AAA family ATPase [Pistricoccus aurantiacus]QEA39339.1 chromosome segregation protein SMC [Pistricoccus aurantiacus]
MKILAIRLENLASLAGRHKLDFTCAPLAEQGLFAITGPTGAGKSTLLDALCLALYGSTPRLRGARQDQARIPDPGATDITSFDPRTLLRRGCASGFAEVDFLGRDRRRYRARWFVRRARNKPEGKLQAVEQSLIDLENGQLLTAQKREFDALLPKRLGLSFEQFTRAVLLAQSEFSAFLKADDNARSELLEKLTDTGEYSKISIAAYRRARQAQQVVAELEQRLAGEPPAEAEARVQLEHEAIESEAELNAARAQAAHLQGERRWLQQDQHLAQAVLDARQRLEQAHRDDDALSEQREQEHRLEQLAPQRHRFQRRETLEGQCRDQERQCASTRLTLSEAERQHARAIEEKRQADSSLEEAIQARRTALPLIETARELAAERDRCEHQRRDKQASRQRIIDTLAKDRQRQDKLQTDYRWQYQELDNLQATLRRQLGEHTDALTARRALLVEQEQADRRRQTLQTLERHWRQWHDCQQHLDALRRQQDSDTRQQSWLLEQGQAAKARLEEVENRQHRLQASIDGLRAARSESVVLLRQQLRDDQPCPVCGSLSHPYRDAPPSEPAQAQLEATEREENRQLHEAAKAVESARERHHDLQGQYRALQAQLTQNAAQIAKLAEETAAHRASLLDQPDGHSLLEQTDAAGWLGDNREQAEGHWRDSRQALETFDTTQQGIAPLRDALQRQEVELGKLVSRCEQQEQSLAALDSELSPLAEQCQRLEQELREALSDHASPADWQASVDSALENARQQADQIREREQQTASEVQRQGQALDHQQQRLAALKEEHGQLDQKLNVWRERHPQLDDAALTTLLAITDADRQVQRERLQKAERERHAAEVSLKERRQTLVDHRRERFADVSDESLLGEDIETRITAWSERLAIEETKLAERQTAIQQRRDAARHALLDDDRRRAYQREVLDELEQARREQHRWSSISELIGSADGKAFRRIAQAYNLEQLLDHANAHLASLSRRYRLTRGGSELGILVIDGDMGDERRSAHSLSGGETFLVSLALALGLASMASGQLRIESLFIDEGFGSLDPQSLALAMEALDGLQAQGRRVGVISHVQEMHERIPVQIRIEPLGNGASRARLVSG